MKVLVTGAAGFIGFHLVSRMLATGNEVTGLDSIDSYYDVNLKFGRLKALGADRKQIEASGWCRSELFPALRFVREDLCNQSALFSLFEEERFDIVCNLAAQAGVRHSLSDPHKYVQSNIVGFMNILEACRAGGVKHLVYASSSSVYGLNQKVPFSVRDNVDHPISIYAATKKSNELMAHCYSYLFGLPTTGLRFFTVYGPWGRPDMALFKFTQAIIRGEPIDVYNNGAMVRDFTFVDDVVEGIGRVITHIAEPARNWDGARPLPDRSSAPYRVYNIGNSQPVKLLEFVEALERELGKKATIRFLPLQAGDVPATIADVQELAQDIGFRPSTPVTEGIRRFVQWYKEFYRQ